MYVLHQYEAESHYEGLKYYCTSVGYEFKFMQLSWFFQLLSGIKNANKNKRLNKGIINLVFLLKLPFTKKKDIVLGLAPYDYRMVFFNLMAKKHRFFYHTSWPYWDGSNFPKRSFHFLFKKTITKAWQSFLEDNCAGIFCVSQFTLGQLTANYKISCPATVVHHSINKGIFFPSKVITVNKPVKFIFSGRLVENKGILILLKFANEFKNKGFVLGIAGGGELAATVKELASDNSDIKIYGKVSREKLGDLYRQYDFLIGPSIKGESWEELFGISIIEAMTCGCVPVATGHVGPREIITEGVNGYFLNDNALYDQIKERVTAIMELKDEEIIALKENAIKEGRNFYSSQIAGRWAVIMDKYIS